MAERDNQEMFEMGWHSGYKQACNEWKYTIDKIKEEIEEKADNNNNALYHDGLLYALYVIDKHIKEM